MTKLKFNKRGIAIKKPSKKAKAKADERRYNELINRAKKKKKFWQIL